MEEFNKNKEMMTIKEKILNLVFFDLIAKLKDILGSLEFGINSLTGRVTKLESNSGSGGGSQDLQSVLDNGTYAENLDNPNSFVDFLNGDNIDLILSNGDWRSRLSMSNNETDGNIALSSNTLSSGVYGQIELDAGKILLFETVDDNSEFFRKTTTVKFETPIALAEDGAATILIPAKPAGTYTLATLEDIEALKNEQGQVKVNYTGLSTVGFVAETLKTLDINGATPTIVSSPTTKFPFSTPNTYAGFFDSARGSSPTGRLIENPIDGQVHTWRFQISYINKGAGNNGSLDLILTNPVSGFQYVMPFTLPSGRTAGTLNNVAITIADEASIPAPNGYILQCRTSFSDANLTIDSISITRISQAVENF